MGLKSQFLYMFFFDPRARFDFVQTPTAVREAFETIHSDQHAVMYQRRFEDRKNVRICNQRFRSLDGLRVIAIVRVDQNAAGPQQPRLDPDLDTHALDGTGKRFLFRFGER